MRLALDARDRRGGLGRWLVAAAILHEIGFAAARVLAATHGQAGDPRLAAAALDVGLDTPAPAPTAPPAAEDEPATATKPPPPPRPITPDPPAKAPALADAANHFFKAAAAAVTGAAHVLTRDDDAPQAVAVANGNVEGPTYGYVAGDGTGTKPTFDPRAQIGGKTGGRGTSSDKDAIVGPDRSRAAHVIGGFASDCDFPSEAKGIDHMMVQVVVHVGNDGKAKNVIVVQDPGHGFGEAARRCALRQMYTAARDRKGGSVEAITAPVVVRFTR
jgi:protein TonB